MCGVCVSVCVRVICVVCVCVSKLCVGCVSSVCMYVSVHVVCLHDGMLVGAWVHRECVCCVCVCVCCVFMGWLVSVCVCAQHVLITTFVCVI